jgi:hypothetical protein
VKTDLWELETSAGDAGDAGGGDSGGGQKESGAPAATPTPAAPASTDEWKPSREEWETVVGGLGFIAHQLFEETGEEQPEVDPTDPAAVAARFKEYVDGRVGEVAQFAQPAVAEAGERKLQALFDGFAKDPDIGDFDRDLAKDLAEKAWTPGQDPHKVAEQAARRAAEIAKRYKTAGREELKKSFSGFNGDQDDAPIQSSAQRGLKPASTYDEVIERYTGDVEVG